jgi:hypothetical protein
MIDNVLIATLPKSGTWYTTCFFWVYRECLLRHFLLSFTKPNLKQGILNHSSHQQTYKIRPIQNLMVFDNECEFTNFWIHHTACPGYVCENDPLGDVWKQLDYFVPDYDLNFERKALCDVSCKNTKTVYLYRNPLDHFISYYRHTLNHKNPKQRLLCDKDGNMRSIENVKDFTFHGSGLDSFIKQYHTFKVMQKLYPDKVLLITYEELIKNPKMTFSKMLAHFGHNIDTFRRRKAFNCALRMTTKDQLKKIENKLGRSLANDQADPAERHIRSGEVGTWKNIFSESDLHQIETRLNEFQISLNDFVIE